MSNVQVVCVCVCLWNNSGVFIFLYSGVGRLIFRVRCMWVALIKCVNENPLELYLWPFVFSRYLTGGAVAAAFSLKFTFYFLSVVYKFLVTRYTQSFANNNQHIDRSTVLVPIRFRVCLCFFFFIFFSKHQRYNTFHTEFFFPFNFVRAMTYSSLISLFAFSLRSLDCCPCKIKTTAASTRLTLCSNSSGNYIRKIPFVSFPRVVFSGEEFFFLSFSFLVWGFARF